MVLTFFELDKITDNVFELWLKKIPEFRRVVVMQHRSKDGQIRSLCAYLLLCVGVGRILENFSFNKHGKPFLPNDELQINLSHGKNAVVVGFGSSPIGVDVEFIRAKYPKMVCDRVFTPLEIEQIENSRNPTLAFFQFWTLKESFAKCIGTGLSFPLKTVEFSITEELEVDCSNENYWFATFSKNGHHVSVCGAEPHVIRNLSFEELSDLVNHL